MPMGQRMQLLTASGRAPTLFWAIPEFGITTQISEMIVAVLKTRMQTSSQILQLTRWHDAADHAPVINPMSSTPPRGISGSIRSHSGIDPSVSPLPVFMVSWPLDPTSIDVEDRAIALLLLSNSLFSRLISLFNCTKMDAEANVFRGFGAFSTFCFEKGVIFPVNFPDTREFRGAAIKMPSLNEISKIAGAGVDRGGLRTLLNHCNMKVGLFELQSETKWLLPSNSASVKACAARKTTR
jgi:hypothetical protein